MGITQVWQAKMPVFKGMPTALSVRRQGPKLEKALWSFDAMVPNVQMKASKVETSPCDVETQALELGRWMPHFDSTGLLEAMAAPKERTRPSREGTEASKARASTSTFEFQERKRGGWLSRFNCQALVVEAVSSKVKAAVSMVEARQWKRGIALPRFHHSCRNFEVSSSRAKAAVSKFRDAASKAIPLESKRDKAMPRSIPPIPKGEDYSWPA